MSTPAIIFGYHSFSVNKFLFVPPRLSNSSITRQTQTTYVNCLLICNISGGKQSFTEPIDLTRQVRDCLENFDQADKPTDTGDANDNLDNPSDESSTSDAPEKSDTSNVANENVGEEINESVKKCNKV